jgi:hypothetical protein
MFFEEGDLLTQLSLIKYKTKYVWLVYIPDEAIIISIGLSYVSDVLYLHDRIHIWKDKKMCHAIVSAHGDALKFVKLKDREIYIAAIENDPTSIKHIPWKARTESLGMRCVSRNGYTIRYLHQTPNECFTAVSTHGKSLEYILHKTFALCKRAIASDPFALPFAEGHVTDAEFYSLMMDAVKRKGLVLRLIKDAPYDVIVEALKQNGDALEFVEYQTEYLCATAIMENPAALRHVREQTYNLCLLAVTLDGWTLSYVENQTKSICLAASKENPASIYCIRKRDTNTYRFAHLNSLILDSSIANMNSLDYPIQIFH